jgi:hypothetical protein
MPPDPCDNSQDARVAAHAYGEEYVLLACLSRHQGDQRQASPGIGLDEARAYCFRVDSCRAHSRGRGLAARQRSLLGARAPPTPATPFRLRRLAA